MDPSGENPAGPDAKGERCASNGNSVASVFHRVRRGPHAHGQQAGGSSRRSVPLSQAQEEIILPGPMGEKRSQRYRAVPLEAVDIHAQKQRETAR